MQLTKDEWWGNYRCTILCQYHSDNFDEWWDPDKYEWSQSSWALAQFCPKHFDKWWNPDKFDWGASSYLAMYCPEYFSEWWDINKFDWELGSDNLSIYCATKFSNACLKQLLLHQDISARQFASEEIKRREDDKAREAMGEQGL